MTVDTIQGALDLIRSDYMDENGLTQKSQILDRVDPSLAGFVERAYTAITAFDDGQEDSLLAFCERYKDVGLKSSQFNKWKEDWKAEFTPHITNKWLQVDFDVGSEERETIIERAVHLSRGEYNSELLTELTQALDSEDVSVRQAALSALAMLDGGHMDFYGIPTLVGALHSPYADVQLSAARKLVPFATTLQGCLELGDIARCMAKKDCDPQLVLTLGQISVNARSGSAEAGEGLARLVRGEFKPEGLSSDQVSQIKQEAARLLGRLSTAVDHQADLVAMLKNGSEGEKKAAGEALTYLGSAAVRDLRNLARDTDQQVRRLAIDSLGGARIVLDEDQVAKQIPNIEQTFKNALADPNRSVRISAAAQLIALYNEQKRNIDEPMRVLGAIATDPAAPDAVVERAVSEIGGSSTYGRFNVSNQSLLLNPLMVALNSPSTDVVIATIESLGYIPSQRSVATVERLALFGKTQDIQSAALKALDDLQSGSDLAVTTQAQSVYDSVTKILEARERTAGTK